MRAGTLAIAAVMATTVLVDAQGAATPASAGLRTVTDIRCAAEIGTGVKTRRTFCDVIIGTTPAESVAMTIPPHTGTVMLRFDLHNRFDVPAAAVPVGMAYARHLAVVAIIRPTGELVGRAVVGGDFRTVENLFDQVAGDGRSGGTKAVAPGPAESISVTVPAGVSSIGIVGTRLNIVKRSGEEAYDTPGRPVALVSRVRVEYRPR
jgi:hypothetical protein